MMAERSRRAGNGVFSGPRVGAFAAGLLSALFLLSGCGAQSENWSARSAVEEESQVGATGEVPASMTANPPGAASANDVTIGADSAQYSDTDPSALTDFKPALDPYGTWEDVPNYGTVWIPSESEVGSDFVPYSTAGHWAYDDNYVWVSDYSWGWAPFHYGRWILIPGRGWAWIPGRVYSGAWVSWAVGPAYVGWAPLAPSWYWYNGYAVGFAFYPTPYYVYCPHGYLFDHHVHTYVVHGPAAVGIAAQTPPYVPARPSVQPGVDQPGRIPASPSVGPDRVAANPTVGPPPRLLGIHDQALVHPSGAGIAKARAFAAPAEAQRLGGRAPASAFAAGATRSSASDPWRLEGQTQMRNSFASPSAGARAPTRSFETRSIGSTTAPRSSPNEPVLSGVYRSGTTAPVIQPSPSAPMARPSSPPYAPSAPVYRSAPVAPSAPVYRSAPTYAPSAPVYRSAPSTPSAPVAPSAPVYRSAPVAPSAPVYHSAPSAPVYRSAPSAPTMHAPPSAPVSRPSSSTSSGSRSSGVRVHR
jgi:hypothetical protein